MKGYDKESEFAVRVLEGHNGVISAIDIQENLLVSGSQDTSIKLWNLSTAKELQNLSGHTGSVSCVKIINEAKSNELWNSIVCDDDVTFKPYRNSFLLLSASDDCTIKLWLLPQGLLLKSIYNFCTISTLLHCQSVVFAGSETGKLTAFNIASGIQLCDSIIHDDKIIFLHWDGKLLMTVSNDGSLKLWELMVADEPSLLLDQMKNEFQVKQKYLFENIGLNLEKRPILSACVYQDRIIFTDDQGTVNIFNVSAGTVINQSSLKESVFADTLFVFDDQLFSTSYHPHSGCGCVNVYSTEESELPFTYGTSFCHPELSRMSCVCVDQPSNSTYFVTGGSKLLAWRKKSTISPKKKNSGAEAFRIKSNRLSDVVKSGAYSDQATGVESHKTLGNRLDQSKDVSNCKQLNDRASGWACLLL